MHYIVQLCLLMRFVPHKTRKKNMLNKWLQYWWIEFRRGADAIECKVFHLTLSARKHKQHGKLRHKLKEEHKGKRWNRVDDFHMHCFDLGAGLDKRISFWMLHNRHPVSYETGLEVTRMIDYTKDEWLNRMDMHVYKTLKPTFLFESTW